MVLPMWVLLPVCTQGRWLVLLLLWPPNTELGLKAAVWSKGVTPLW